MPYTVVIADDVTGANDIGIMYAKAGLTALVYSLGEGDKPDYRDCDVLIIDTDSRFDTGEKAYEKVSRALKIIPGKGVRQYINKQCSVFRGNIGAEFDAMLDTLSEEFAVVVLGFPDNGRTTLHSMHYVNGILLKDSQFRNDPIHPMRESDLTSILGSQTKRQVGAIHYEVYDRGEQALKKALEEAKKTCNYCIMDVRDNRDLELLAGILQQERVICGSSALSEYLARLKQPEEEGMALRIENEQEDERVFCIAGSLTPQTMAQTEYMKQGGYPVFQLDTRRLFTEREREEEMDRILALVKGAYGAGDFAMVHSMNNPAMVAQTKEIAAGLGYNNTEVSSLVSSALSGICLRVTGQYGIRNLIVCGGDTSAALCAGLKVRGMQVLNEIETGLPTCRSVDPPYYRMVLKSGSFGSPEFLEKAWKKLKESQK